MAGPIRDGARLLRLVCCHADRPDEPRRRCTGCGAAYHADCFERFGCCPGASVETLPPASATGPAPGPR